MSLHLNLVEDLIQRQGLGLVHLMVHEIAQKPAGKQDQALHRLYRLSTLLTPGVAQQMKPDSPHILIIIFKSFFFIHVHKLLYSFMIPPHLTQVLVLIQLRTKSALPLRVPKRACICSLSQVDGMRD